MLMQSTKLFDGFSTCFRQWRASHSHCQYLHGYAMSFKVWFKGTLDDKNWVADFGTFKRNGTTEELNYWFDHTTLVAEDDPELPWFKEADRKGLLQLRIVPAVGAERCAQRVYSIVNRRIQEETTQRVCVVRVECFENERNSAIYEPES